MTRDPDRIDDVLGEVEEYWKEHPDLRLGQIMMNMANRQGFSDCFYIEDETLLREFQKENDNS